MRGKLVSQDINDTPARDLLIEIKAEKERLIKEGKIKKSENLPLITPDEIPDKIPDNWEWVRLGQITEYNGIINIKSQDIQPHIGLLDLLRNSKI